MAHPQLLNISQVQITYVKYKGWIYNGKTEWPINKFEVLNAHGNVKSYCARSTKLTTGQPARLALTPGNCTTSNSINNNMSSAIESNDVSLTISGVNTPPNGYRKPFGKQPDSPEDMSASNQIVSEAGNNLLNASNSGGMSNMFWKFIGLDTTTATSTLSGNENEQDSSQNRTLVVPVFELSENVPNTEAFESSLVQGHSSGDDKAKQLSGGSDDESLFRSTELEDLNADRDLHDNVKHLRTFTSESHFLSFFLLHQIFKSFSHSLFFPFLLFFHKISFNFLFLSLPSFSF